MSTFKQRYESVLSWDMPAYQVETLPYLEDDSIGEFLLLAPPGYSRSTLLCFLAADMLGRNPNEHIFIVSPTMTNSVRLLQFIEDIMSSAGYKAIYGDIIPSDDELSFRLHRAEEGFTDLQPSISAPAAWEEIAKWDPARRRWPVWTSTQKCVRRSGWKSPLPSLLALGVCGAISGYQATRILVDSIVTQENSLSAARRAYLANWYFGSLMLKLRPGGRVIVIGTRLYAEDLYGQLLNLYPHKVFKSSPEVPLWPEGFPAEMLEKERACDTASFAAQYGQEPAV